MTVFHSAFGEVLLERLPLRQRETLLPYDNADILILAEAFAKIHDGAKLLIVNDPFGALAVSLKNYERTLWSDSCVSQGAIEHNCALNNISVLPTFLPATDSLTSLPAPDLVLLKLPKSLAFLDYQLRCIQRVMTSNTSIIAGAMSKYIERSHIQLFENILGPTVTRLAEKKARLILPTMDPDKPALPSPPPTIVTVPEYDLTLTHHANVFSRERLDVGARCLIEELDRMSDVPTIDVQAFDSKTVIDLGCGNGVLGILAQRKYPNARLQFFDESYMAIASAKASYQVANDTDTTAEFYVNDCLDNVAAESADLILCNPPFHQHQAISESVARKMFQQSHAVLRKGGELWVVANRHLPYFGVLKKRFSAVEVVGENRKFSIYRCRK